MPVLQSFPETKVRDLKAGDKTTYGEVIAVDRKLKWGVVTFQGQKAPYEKRLELDELIGCSRMMETEEEAHAKAVARRVMSLDWKEQAHRGELAAARAKMIAEMQAGERASFWHWMDVPLAEAKVEIWDAIAHVHLQRFMHDAEVTRVDAVREVLATRQAAALSYYSATSRSTGTVSNLFDDLKLQALSEIMRDVEFAIA